MTDKAVGKEQPTSVPSDRRASRTSQASKHSDTQKTPVSPTKEEVQSPLKNEEGHVVPVRTAPPPPPSKKKVSEEPIISDDQAYTYDSSTVQSEFGDTSQIYQGYGGEACGAYDYDQAYTYDPNTVQSEFEDPSQLYQGYYQGYGGEAYGAHDSSTPNYDYNQAQYGTDTGYNQYYGEYTTADQPYNYSVTSNEQAYTYDPNTGQYTYTYSEQQTNYDYDPSAYNAGYDQSGLQTGVVGADDTSSASVSPRHDVSPSAERISTEETDQQSAAPQTVNYDYSQYDYNQQDYSAYPATDYTITVNEPEPSTTDAFDTSAYGTNYSAYDSQVDTSQYEPPTLPIAPMLPQQRPRTPDPFSWETQEKFYEDTGSALPPPRPSPVAKAYEPAVTEAKEEDSSFEFKGIRVL